MSTNQKTYSTPSLDGKGDVVKATRFRSVGILEPNSNQPKDGAGDIGFGL